MPRRLDKKSVTVLVAALAFLAVLAFGLSRWSLFYEQYYLRYLPGPTNPCDMDEDQRHVIATLGRLRSARAAPGIVALMRQCDCTIKTDDPFGEHEDCLDEALVEIGKPAVVPVLDAMTFMDSDHKYDLRLASLVRRILLERNATLGDLFGFAQFLKGVSDDPHEDPRVREAARRALERLEE